MKQKIKIFCDNIFRTKQEIDYGLKVIKRDLGRGDPGNDAVYTFLTQDADAEKNAILKQIAQSYNQGIFSRSFIPSIIGQSLGGSKLQDKPELVWDNNTLILNYKGAFLSDPRVVTNAGEQKQLDEREKELCTQQIEITKDTITIILVCGKSFSIGSAKTNHADLEELATTLHNTYSAFKEYDQADKTMELSDKEWLKGAAVDHTLHGSSPKKPMEPRHKALIAAASFAALAVATGIAWGVTDNFTLLIVMVISILGASASVVASAILSNNKEGLFDSKNQQSSNGTDLSKKSLTD